MPRHETNSPTERMLRVLDEIEGLTSYIAALEARLIKHDLLAGLPPSPHMEAIASERTRQALGLSKTRSKRQYMRRVRTSTDFGDQATSQRHARTLVHDTEPPQYVQESPAPPPLSGAALEALFEQTVNAEPVAPTPAELIERAERARAVDARIGTGPAEIEPDAEAMKPEDILGHKGGLFR